MNISIPGRKSEKAVAYRLSILCLLILFFCQGFQGKESINGKQLYDKKCKKCHGADGTKGAFKATNLQASMIEKNIIFAVLTTGRNKMPSFSKSLDPNEMTAVADYVMSLRKK
jgi:cytochrome c6